MVALILGIGLLGGVLLYPGVPMGSFMEPENPPVESISSHPAPIQIPDLGLWRRNPVEADLKYKDKLVEIVMNLQLLKISGAGLVSIDKRSLGIPIIQPVVFRIDRRNGNQLLHIRGKHGNIVIRGKCSGMNKDEIVEFTNCDIVSLHSKHESE
jgi:hypothetical protein